MAEVEGLDKIKAAIKNNEIWIAESLGRALFDEAQDIMRKSQRLVPVDTGVLRASKVVLPPRFIGKSIRVDMGYGAPYAAAVHDREFSFKGKLVYHKPPTRAKYLSAPLEEAQEGYIDRIQRRTAVIWNRKKASF